MILYYFLNHRVTDSGASVSGGVPVNYSNFVSGLCLVEVCGNDFLVPIPFPLPSNHSRSHSHPFPLPFPAAVATII